MKKCTNCGKCCTNTRYMTSLSAEPHDVARWRAEGRDDILRFAWVMADGHADLWIDDDGEERTRCPFVRKVRGSKRYLCRIYDTRPQVCRDYVPWAEGTICEEVTEC